METATAVAGVITVALALGHETLGRTWILPKLREDSLPATPFGPPRTTQHMIRVTWHIVTVFALAGGGLLLTLAWTPAHAGTLVLRWFAAMWLVAAAIAFLITRPRLRRIVRMPVPLLWLVVAALCWQAST